MTPRTKHRVRWGVAIAIVLAIFAVGLWMLMAARMSNPWNAKTIGEIPVPRGFERVEAKRGSYADYLRNLPLKPRGSRVQLYTGGDARLQFLSSAVVDQKLLSNWEQCADATMRIRAEYLWKSHRYGEICFKDVNGSRLRYQGGGSRKAFEAYMRKVYGVCSTTSLYHETHAVAIKDVRPGDVLVYKSRHKGAYGHAVLVADVARNGSGKTAIMCVEGNTPAREEHMVRNPNVLRNPWFILGDDDENIRISCFRFGKDELRRY